MSFFDLIGPTGRLCEHSFGPPIRSIQRGIVAGTPSKSEECAFAMRLLAQSRAYLNQGGDGFYALEYYHVLVPIVFSLPRITGQRLRGMVINLLAKSGNRCVMCVMTE